MCNVIAEVRRELAEKIFMKKRPEESLRVVRIRSCSWNIQGPGGMDLSRFESILELLDEGQMVSSLPR